MPSISSPLRKTVSVAPALTMMPFVPETKTPASTLSQIMAIDLVMVKAPKPPGSMQLISPLGAVLEMAPAKVLHGAVRLHGLASSPTPDTQVRVAWALAGTAVNPVNIAHPSRTAHNQFGFICPSLGIIEVLD